MDNIFIEGGQKIPKVDFNFETGTFLLEGISVPEDTVDFYHPIVYALQQYVQNPKEKTVMDLKLEYFNTSTSVILLNIFRVICKIEDQNLTINWYYEADDEEMKEAGIDYSNMVNHPFNVIKVDSF